MVFELPFEIGKEFDHFGRLKNGLVLRYGLNKKGTFYFVYFSLFIIHSEMFMQGYKHQNF
jgi:hypothetical protein